MKKSSSTTPNQKPKRGLFWFRNDLRLTDQVALASLSQKVDELTLLYIIDDSCFIPNAYGVQPVGEHRFNFILESLEDLNEQLAPLGHSILALKGQAAEILVALLANDDFDCLGVTHCGGYNESKQIDAVMKFFPNLDMVIEESNTLFNQSDLPFVLSQIPDVFTPFKQKIEKSITPRTPIEKISFLPTQFVPHVKETCKFTLNRYLKKSQVEGAFTGGEMAALSHLNAYLFEWRAAQTYKETRNALEHWRGSTKLSPWLAVGAISPRTIMQQVKLFERNIIENDSTYWIYFELLWREYFSWLQQKYGPKWFQFSGIRPGSPNTIHDPHVFISWCNGETGYPIVDACMRQLAQTGYVSNRGRQLVASCFVNELRQDWRYGAAWFEHHLIDYDVASNWGNWLYLAGVGTDSREHRKFNLQKQTEIFDPTGEFRSKWLS
ncbi:DASH family cryptochrome [Alteromonas sp. 1_MG-2023]|uniref:DASH family cryptochrome n=1 Tax=Alteromonas sp. 1_MG-2023 TaxID=3062669 RepID=UPI0026E4277A|nr:DASH family cryptochrome [Alteromonas sp. 1_MG-2023]MDO6565870.1 DASH family cryptochrome [Alteromonas sp. 1_MG-2023]